MIAAPADHGPETGVVVSARGDPGLLFCPVVLVDVDVVERSHRLRLADGSRAFASGWKLERRATSSGLGGRAREL